MEWTKELRVGDVVQGVFPEVDFHGGAWSVLWVVVLGADGLTRKMPICGEEVVQLVDLDILRVADIVQYRILAKVRSVAQGNDNG